MTGRLRDWHQARHRARRAASRAPGHQRPALGAVTGTRSWAPEAGPQAIQHRPRRLRCQSRDFGHATSVPCQSHAPVTRARCQSHAPAPHRRDSRPRPQPAPRQGAPPTRCLQHDRPRLDPHQEPRFTYVLEVYKTFMPTPLTPRAPKRETRIRSGVHPLQEEMLRRPEGGRTRELEPASTGVRRAAHRPVRAPGRAKSRGSRGAPSGASTFHRNRSP